MINKDIHEHIHSLMFLNTVFISNVVELSSFQCSLERDCTTFQQKRAASVLCLIITAENASCDIMIMIPSIWHADLFFCLRCYFDIRSA